MKIYLYNVGQITKIAAISIFMIKKETFKSSSPEPVGRFRRSLWLKPIIVCSNDHPGLTLAFLRPDQSFNLGFYMGQCENYGVCIRQVVN